jgi:hypothetical protein
MRHLCALLLGAALLSPAAGARAGTFPRDEVITEPTPERFSVCYDFGCASIAFVSLAPEEWAQIRSRFEPPATDAAAERERVREAIALLERITGERIGTKKDKGGTFFSGEGDFQMDCIDESTNTTYYMRMLERQGLLRWHRVGETVTRGWFLFGWPHTAATLVERDGGARWVVDSWFLDNGYPPFILPVELWRSGWNPPETAKPAATQ